MMKRLRTGCILTALALAVGAVAADTGEFGDFKTPQARNALEVYNGTLSKLTRDYKERTEAARKVCVNQLTIAQQAATKAGNLDEAVHIRDAIGKLNAANAAEPATGSGHSSVGGGLLADRQKLSQALANTVWQSGDAKLKFNEDGTGVYGDGKGWEWVAINGREAYIRFNNGFFVRLIFDDGFKTFGYYECGSGTKREAQAGRRLQ